MLGVLGLVAGRFGLSAIPAYIVAGLLLGPHPPHITSVIDPSDVTRFLAELGVVLLLFFLGLEFSFDRLTRTGRLMTRSGLVDLAINASLGLVVGFLAFGVSLAGAILAGAIYVSSSALTVKGLIDFRRLADDETDLVLAVLLFEDLVIAVFLGFSGSGGGWHDTAFALVKAIAFVGIAVGLARHGAPQLARVLGRLNAETRLLLAVAFVVSVAAAAKALGLSEAIGALMAGVVLAGTPLREELEQRLLAVRDIFAAFFFFVFGLSVNVAALDNIGWVLGLAIVATLVGKSLTGLVAAELTGFTRRQGVNVGAALIAHGEFTIILAEIASRNDAIAADVRADLVAFAGLYVLASATLGTALMQQSKRIGRRLFAVRASTGGPRE